VAIGMFHAGYVAAALQRQVGTEFDSENISFYALLVIYINSINISPIMIINRIYETQNLLSL
jgi:hypothetical protein